MQKGLLPTPRVKNEGCPGDPAAVVVAVFSAASGGGASCREIEG